jgi:hypothetical protein
MALRVVFVLASETDPDPVELLADTEQLLADMNFSGPARPSQPDGNRKERLQEFTDKKGDDSDRS